MGALSRISIRGRYYHKDGKPYPSLRAQIYRHAIGNFAWLCSEVGSSQGDETFRSLALLAVNAFPDREYGYNLMGTHYSTIDTKPRLASVELRARPQLVPNDPLVWANVGVVHIMAGERSEAAEAFNKVIALNNFPGLRRAGNMKPAELASLK